jgi:sulfur carrier protein
MLNVQVNGRKTTLAQGSTVASLVTTMQLEGKRFAIERNGEIVPKGALGTVPVQEGDAYEIVIAVGGG